MKYFVQVVGSLLLACLVLSSSVQASSIVITYTPEDQRMLDEYLENDFNNAIEDVPIISYIANKIENGTSDLDIFNGCKLVYRMSDKHRTYFDHILVERFVDEIESRTLSLDYFVDGGNLFHAMYSLGITRTDLSIEFLLGMMEPIENWPESFRVNVLKPGNKNQLIKDLREAAMGALLQPQDEKGKELLSVIEQKVTNFNDNDEYKGYLLYNVDVWKKIYEEAAVKNYKDYQ
ncbi:MAG: hypothetical protein GC154_13775 [bacterium]|nr:hypothetical protein [bacterium]